VSDLTPLQRLAGLQTLYLYGCTAVSDLTPLQRLAGLQTLYLYGCTAVSEEALAALKGALPGCEVRR